MVAHYGQYHNYHGGNCTRYKETDGLGRQRAPTQHAWSTKMQPVMLCLTYLRWNSDSCNFGIQPYEGLVEPSVNVNRYQKKSNFSNEYVIIQATKKKVILAINM